MPFKPQSAVKFALHAIIPKSQQSASFLDSAAIILLSFSADPISVSSGSAGRHPAPPYPPSQYAVAL
ncbi:hypothetical protein BL127_00010405 [Raoultella planticola]|nr:hypothetical protein BL127_00010405 [Raoultella planticola]TXV02203.1 hypothetical protein D4M92_20735 [Klebsiella michiganensis]